MKWMDCTRMRIGYDMYDAGAVVLGGKGKA